MDIANLESNKITLAHLEEDFWKFIDTHFPDRRDIEHILQSHGKINECLQSPKGTLKCIICRLHQQKAIQIGRGRFVQHSGGRGKIQTDVQVLPRAFPEGARIHPHYSQEGGVQRH